MTLLTGWSLEGDPTGTTTLTVDIVNGEFKLIPPNQENVAMLSSPAEVTVPVTTTTPTGPIQPGVPGETTTHPVILGSCAEGLTHQGNMCIT